MTKTENLETKWKHKLRSKIAGIDWVEEMDGSERVIHQQIEKWKRVYREQERKAQKIKRLGDGKDKTTRLFFDMLAKYQHEVKADEARKKVWQLKRICSDKEVEEDNWFDYHTLEMARAIPIEDFIEGSPKVTGSRLFFPCPFHEEKTPSFCVFTNTNTYHCFGCQENGDVIDFIMKIRNLSFREAITYLLPSKRK